MGSVLDVLQFGAHVAGNAVRVVWVGEQCLRTLVKQRGHAARSVSLKNFGGLQFG